MESKYKFVSVILALALVASLSRLVYVVSADSDKVEQTADAKSVVWQNIMSRKSVRSYTDQPISREQIDTLLRAAMAAPSGKDMRPWKFLVLDDSLAIKDFAAKVPRAKMLAEAKAVVVVCGDMTVTGDDGKPSYSWVLDCSLASENLLLMAEAMGLGAVWVSVHPREERIAEVRQALNLPEHLMPLNIIPLGYPKGDAKPKDKYNADNIYYNKW